MGAADRLYEELVAPIEERMMSTVAGILVDPDDAADAMQNALVYVWRNLRKIHQHPNPHGYILRACISAAYDVARRKAVRRRREAPLPGEPTAADPPVEARQEGVGTLSAIRSGIATLPKKQAEAVLLRLIRDRGRGPAVRRGYSAGGHRQTLGGGAFRTAHPSRPGRGT